MGYLDDELYSRAFGAFNLLATGTYAVASVAGGEHKRVVRWAVCRGKEDFSDKVKYYNNATATIALSLIQRPLMLPSVYYILAAHYLLVLCACLLLVADGHLRRSKLPGEVLPTGAAAVIHLRDALIPGKQTQLNKA